MCRSDAFIGTNTLNPFSYQKFGLNEIIIYRYGFATAGTPMSTTDNKRLYHNSMAALAYVKNGHGMSLSDFPNHYLMVFDLTSTQEATHDFIHPELQTLHYMWNSTSVQRCLATLKFYFSGRNVQHFISILRETFPKTLFL